MFNTLSSNVSAKLQDVHIWWGFDAVIYVDDAEIIEDTRSAATIPTVLQTPSTINLNASN